MDILSPHLAAQFFREKMDEYVEEFWTVALTSGKSIIATKCLFRGTVDACLIHPRDIFRFACLHNASSLLISHNHPSGDAHPSKQDIILTLRLLNISSLMQIPILDHIIVTKTKFTSFRENSWFKNRSIFK